MPRNAFFLYLGAILLLPGCVDSAHAAEVYRIWTDITGNHTTEAQLVACANAKVTLKRKDGSQITLPFDRLSKRDQEFVSKSVFASTEKPAAKPPDEKSKADAALRDFEADLKGPWQLKSSSALLKIVFNYRRYELTLDAKSAARRITVKEKGAFRADPSTGSLTIGGFKLKWIDEDRLECIGTMRTSEELIHVDGVLYRLKK